MKRGAVGAFIFVALLFLVLGVSAVSAVTVLSDCGEIKVAGEYELGADILGQSGTCFTITADNVIFDGKGYGIDGDDSGTDYGINAEDRTGITIKNVNREPEIRDYLPLQSLDSTKLIVPTDKSIIFQAITQDLDGDKLEYEWDFGLMKGGVKGTDTITRTFLVPGKKTVQVTINDGRDSVQKSWDIEVVAPGGNTPIESDLPVVEFDSPVEEKPFSIGIYVVDG